MPYAYVAAVLCFLVVGLFFLTTRTLADDEITAPVVPVLSSIEGSEAEPVVVEETAVVAEEPVVTETTAAEEPVEVTEEPIVVSEEPIFTEEPVTDNLVTVEPVISSNEPVIEEPITASEEPVIVTVEPVTTSDVSISEPTPSPELTTDKADYLPGETATIFGRFFAALENIILKIFGTDETGGSYTETTQNVTTDSVGAFTTPYTLDNIYRPLYTVIASNLFGEELARTTFTDAPLVSDFKQCANKDSTLGDCHWITSILQQSNANYLEGMSVPQRVLFTNIPSTSGNVHTLTLRHQASKAGIHAYDWLTSYSQAIAAAAAEGVAYTDLNGQACNAEIGPPGSLGATCASVRSGGNTFDVIVPDDPFISADGSTQDRIDAYETTYGNRTIKIYGNSAVSAGSLILSHSVADLGDTGDSDINYTLTWTSASDKILIELAGHLAISGDGSGDSWGVGNGSSQISGGPYHFHLDLLDGSSLGNQDNQIKGADILLPPASLISGLKFNDFNANGVMDSSDTPLPGWTITLSGDASDSTVTAGDGTYSFADIADGTYTICETFQAGYTQTYPSSGTVCPDGFGHTVVVSGSDVTGIDFGNNQLGTIVVDKVTVPSGDSESFSFVTTGTGYSSFALTDSATPDSQTLVSGAYSVAETVPAGWSLAAPVCVSSIGDTESAASLELDAGETITCTFTNTKLGTVVIVKNAIPDSGENFNFSGDFGSFSLDDDTDGTLPNQTSFTNLTPGSYSVTESDFSDWDLTALNCVDPSGGTSVNLGTETASISVAAGETVTCTFENTRRARIRIDKVTNPPGDTTVFDFDLTGGPGSVNIDADLADSTDPIFTTGFSLLPGTGYSVVENTPLGWDLTSATCSDNSNPNNISLDPGESVTCTFTNTKLTSSIVTELHKTDESIVTNGSFVMLGTIMHDKATVTTNIGTPTGDVVFTFYNNNSCSENGIGAGTVTLNGIGVAHPSNSQGPLGAGSYSFKAHYNGDGNYPASDSDCEPFSVSKAQLTVTTQVHNASDEDITNTSVALGSVAHDTAAVSGEVAGFPIPAISFTLNTSPVANDTTEAGYDATSVATAPLAAGSYVYQASVAGDDNYLGDTSEEEPFTVVDARISIVESATNEIDDAHIFTITVEQSVADGVWTPVSGATVDVDVAPFPDGGLNETDCADGTDVNGQCTATINSSVAGVFTADASANISVNSVIFNLTTDGVGENSDSAVKTYVDASIALTPQIGTNNINDEHEIIATVTKDEGAGPVPAEGETVTFDVTLGTADFVGGVNTCLTNELGICSVSIVDDTPGDNEVDASVTVTSGSLELDRSTTADAGPNGSDEAKKTYIAGKIIIQKVTVGDDGDFIFTASYDNNGFTLSNGESDNSGWIVTGPYSVSENVPIGWDLTSATCDDDDSTDPANLTLDADEVITCTFTNTKQGKITIVKDADPNDLQDFTFTRSFGANFLLDDDLNVAGIGEGTDIDQNQSASFNNLPANTDYTVTETLPSQYWTLDSITCVNTANQSPYAVVNVTNGVAISLTPGVDVTCTFQNDKLTPTRTQGFWQTHTAFTSSLFNSLFVTPYGGMQIGTNPTKISTNGQLFGAYYSSIAKKSTGQNRNALDKARMQLLQQLVTAKLNCAAFGCPSSITAMIAAADTAYQTGTVAQILASASALNGYNNSGDTIIISPPLPVPGKATPKISQSTALKSYWDVLP